MEGGAAAAAVALPLLPTVGFLTRYLAFSIAGLQGANVIALSLPLSELIVVGAWSCLIATVFLAFFTFSKPGSWGSPARLVQRGGPGIAIWSVGGALVLLAWVVVVLVTAFPSGLLAVVSGSVAGLWGSYVAERVRAGGNILLLLPVMFTLLLSGVITGGVGGSPVGVYRASALTVDPATNSTRTLDVAILGSDAGGFWLQGCGTGQAPEYVLRDSVKSIEPRESAPETTVNLFEIIFRGQHSRIGYRRPC